MNAKIIFPATYYLDQTIEKKHIPKIKWKLVHSPKRTNFYLILLSSSEAEQLDIICSKELAGKLYQNKEFVIYGIAQTKENAMNLIAEMTEKCFQKYGHYNLREYLTCGPLF